MIPAMPGGPKTFHHGEFPLARLAVAKGARLITVCIPAHNEAQSVGAVVRSVAEAHLAERGGSGLVDEILVVDDGSTDRTGAVARAEGARVLTLEGNAGKGQAMRAGLEAACGELIVYLDADVEDTTPGFVSGLVGPLLTDEEISLVKGFYERPIGGAPSGGGRVTELVARPVIELFFPDLVGVRQPLAGETAGHRWVFEKSDFAPGYGVEVGLLVDVARRFGPGSIAQVDLGIRTHRNRPLDELRPQAIDVLRTALGRAGVDLDEYRDRPDH